MPHINTLINVLSYVLPFFNEIANILTSTDLPMFRGLYKKCIDKYLLPHNVIKTISKDKICTTRDVISKLIIDILSLLGLVINIAKNAIHHGYLTSILNGIFVVIISIIIPNLYLQRMINYIKAFFKVKKAYMSIIIGLGFIAVGIGIMIVIEKLIYNLVSDIVIDTDTE